jgi:PAS domain S-box-containing protein
MDKKKFVRYFSVFGIMLIIGVFTFNFFEKNTLVNEHADEAINFSNNFFNTFESQDTKAISSTLDSVLYNPTFKELFIKQDRVALNMYGQPLFQKLKENYGITHFYFHLPDGIIFLRLHDPLNFGDKNTRITFDQAVESQNIGFGLELGKTAFASRVVKPFFDNGKLIGYVELGQEIDHFLGVLKKQTQNNYALFVKKENIKQEDWASVRKKAGLENNWNQYNEFISINDTLNGDAYSMKIRSLCFNEDNAKSSFSLSQNQLTFKNIDSQTSCSSFKIFNANKKLVGVVLLSYDFSQELPAINNFIYKNIIIIIILLILSIIFVNFIIKKSTVSEKKFKYLFDYSEDAILTLAPPSWKFTDGNPAALKIYGIKDNDQLNLITPGDVSPQYQPDGELSSEKAKKMIELAMDKGFSSFEWMHKKLNGPEFLCNVSLVRVSLDNKVFLQAIVRDITIVKNTIEIIKKSEQEAIKAKEEAIKSEEEAKKALLMSERSNNLMVGRELEMIKLKKELQELKSRIGQNEN